MTIQEASETVVFKKLKEGDGGVICVDKYGNLSLVFNSIGMFRGVADSNGKNEVKIWNWLLKE